MNVLAAIIIHWNTMKLGDVERHFRNAKVRPIPDGTTEIQKLVIGRNLTGLNAF